MPYAATTLQADLKSGGISNHSAREAAYHVARAGGHSAGRGTRAYTLSKREVIEAALIATAFDGTLPGSSDLERVHNTILVHGVVEAIENLTDSELAASVFMVDRGGTVLRVWSVNLPFGMHGETDVHFERFPAVSIPCGRINTIDGTILASVIANAR